MKNKLALIFCVLFVIALIFGVVMTSQKNALNKDLTAAKTTLTETETKLSDLTKKQEETAAALETAQTELTESKTLQETTAKTLEETAAALEAAQTELTETKTLHETTAKTLEETAASLRHSRRLRPRALKKRRLR